MQRIICLSLVVMTIAMCVGAFMMRSDPGDEPFVVMDSIVTIFACATLALAVVLRLVMKRRASGLEGGERAAMLWQSRLAPIAILEGGAMMAAVVYYIGAPDVPALVVMVVHPLLMLGFAPLSDPDAAQQLKLD